MNSLANRLKQARKAAGLTQAQLGEKIGVSQNAIQKIERGGNTTHIVQLSEVLKVSPNWLQTGEGDANFSSLDIEVKEKEKEYEDNAIIFNVLDVKASAGFGASGDVVEVINQIKFNAESYLKLFRGMNPINISIISVKGDSMSPTFENGDLLFIDTSVDSYDGDGVYVFTYDNYIFVKRIQKTGKHFTVISDNKHYDPWVLDGECYIHGKVKVHQSQKLNFLA